MLNKRNQHITFKFYYNHFRIWFSRLNSVIIAWKYQYGDVKQEWNQTEYENKITDNEAEVGMNEILKRTRCKLT